MNLYEENISKDKLLWLAGLLDAEGCFSENNGGKPSHHGGKQTRVYLAMTDLDIVEYVRELIGHTGKVGLPKKAKDHHKKLYGIQVYGKKARDLSLVLAPYMSDRRRERVSYLTEIDVHSAWNQLHEYQRYSWVSGYIEGEGCIRWAKGNAYKHDGLYTFQLGTTDEDAVVRVGDALGLSVAYYHTPSRIKAGWKPQWLIQTCKQQSVYDILTKLRPQMFTKKGSEIDEALKFFDTNYPQLQERL